MADDTRRSIDNASGIEAFRARFYGRLLLLLAIGLVFLTAVGTHLMTGLAGLVCFIAVALVTLLVPDTAEQDRRASTTAAGTETALVEATRMFAEALPDPCIIIDRRSVVIHTNSAAQSYFPGVTVGGPIAFTLRNPTLLNAIEAARAQGTQQVELHQSIPTETWYRTTIAPLGELVEGSEGILVITLQSLTESRRLDSLRTDFVANASHELRTPLTSLVGFIDTLLGPAANDREARERFLNIMRGQAARMSKLIDDLLSLSRIEMRQHVRPNAKVTLNSLIREVCEGLQKLAEDAGAPLVITIPPEPVVITGDRDELYEVFENLIDNAIKYGADGGSIEVSLTTSPGRQGFDALVSVTDHGAGVAQEHVPRLTERFYRVDAESSRKKKGTGLGLAIVKHIVTRHHGLMLIRSQPGQGTRVEVFLKA
jgi:two-component system, OmpR family, phosphate regulon sensor histidine kinase PhoR